MQGISGGSGIAGALQLARQLVIGIAQVIYIGAYIIDDILKEYCGLGLLPVAVLGVATLQLLGLAGSVLGRGAGV